jgi:hypothetical protein
MTLQEYFDRLLKTGREDWTVIACWGASSGPSYRERIEAEGTHVQVEAHSTVASLKSDLQVSLAWGFPHMRNFEEEWANSFPDRKASSHFLDFLFNGVLVFREVYVAVDGGRCMLPLPDPQTVPTPETKEITGCEISFDQCTFFRLLNSLESNVDFDDYVRRAGIRVVEKPWIR